MNRPTGKRQIYRTPGRLVVIALACLYGAPACLVAGGILEAIGSRGEPFFALSGLFGAIWGPILLLAIYVQLVGPTPSDHLDRPTSPEEPER